MTINEQLPIDQEIDDDCWNLSNSPFFADIDLDIPAKPIGFSIPRPHRPPMDPKYAQETIAYLKKLAALSEPVKTV